MIYGHSLNCNFNAVCLFVVVVRSALHTLTLEYSVNVCRQRCMNLIRYARDDRISVKKRRVFPPWIDYKKRKIRFMLLIKLKKKLGDIEIKNSRWSLSRGWFIIFFSFLHSLFSPFFLLQFFFLYSSWFMRRSIFIIFAKLCEHYLQNFSSSSFYVNRM